jgi:hypothetical protein
MVVSQIIRKKARIGKVVRFEPQDLELINEDLAIMVSFEQVVCMRLCERIKGYNEKLSENFALNFIGVSATIMGITFRVMEETLSAGTDIPPHG